MITYADLTGQRWRIHRRIHHHDGTPPMTFDGSAWFEPDADGHVYHEHGTLLGQNSKVFTAERRYLWRDAGDSVSVAFDDGRPFHDIPLTGGAAAHWCPPDRYEVTYAFVDWPRWRAVWTVQGPRKDYTMRSDYHPDPG